LTRLQEWVEVAKRITKFAFEQGFIYTDKVSKFEAGQLAASAGHSNVALILEDLCLMGVGAILFSFMIHGRTKSI